MGKDELSVRWKNGSDLLYNSQNFQYYNWHPLVGIETGLATIDKIRRTEKK